MRLEIHAPPAGPATSDEVVLDGTPVALLDEDRILIVLAGRGELRLTRPGVAGLAPPLFPVEAGQSVFPFPFAGALRLVFHSEPDTRIRWADRRAAEIEATRSPEAAVAWTVAIHAWLGLLGRFVPELNAAPTSAEAWLVSAGDDRLARLFEATQRSAAQVFVAALADLERTHAARIHQRRDADHAAIDAVLAEITHSDGPSVAPSIAPSTSLAEAFAAVAAALGVRRPEAAPLTPSEDPTTALDDLARHWGLRLRPVRLEQGWWRTGGEPMLAFGADDRRPVALLPARAGFTVRLPDGARRRLSGDMAASLEPRAFQLIQGFGLGRLGITVPLRSIMRGLGGKIGAVFAYSTLPALAGLVTPYASSLLLGDIIPSGMRPELFAMTAALTAAAFGAVAFEWARARAVARLATLVNARAEAALWDRLLRLPAGFFRTYTVGDLALRADAVNQMREVMSGATVGALLGAVFGALNLVLMLVVSWKLTLVVVALLAVEIAVMLAASLVQLHLQRRMQTLAGAQGGLSVQLIDGIDKLRVAGAEVRAFTRWAAGFGRIRWTERRARQWQGSSTSFLVAWAVLGTIAIDAAVGFGWARLDLGGFVAFTAAAGQFGAAVLSIAGLVPALLALIPLYDRAKPILEAEPETGGGGADPGRLSGAIDVQSVTFRYAAGGPAILDRLSLRIEPGEFVAIVGPSGSGKSTLLRLLLGFERPEIGGVFLDGRDLAGLDKARVRRQIGTVLQNGRLFGGSILENVAAGAPLTPDEAMAALKRAGLEADLGAMPMGLHTAIAEGGGGLSGGQRQRLMIARALARQPRILLFDEATSALDNRTQALVSESLGRMSVTRIAVAHRLSTVQDADRIVVMQDGAIVETGSYDELMRRRGAFFRLAERQLH
ncbi:NHLP bacteriocin export ABC transporter permease/ATPase subunit [Methylobacterium sp. 22177]|uniref:NHLP bacteriocin export ABC transporter permease/ATPase subunit n=1 Tax=Methylobacterium sp. 22177 TaxID=3453885 RepID=UPI003F852518